jgi:hypothetical protein
VDLVLGLSMTAMTFPHRLLRSELRSWQITPRNTGSVPVDNTLHDPTVITERMTTPTLIESNNAEINSH